MVSQQNSDRVPAYLDLLRPCHLVREVHHLSLNQYLMGLAPYRTELEMPQDGHSKPEALPNQTIKHQHKIKICTHVQACTCNNLHACFYVCSTRERERELTNGNRASAPCISGNKERKEKSLGFFFYKLKKKKKKKNGKSNKMKLTIAKTKVSFSLK